MNWVLSTLETWIDSVFRTALSNKYWVLCLCFRHGTWSTKKLSDFTKVSPPGSNRVVRFLLDPTLWNTVWCSPGDLPKGKFYNQGEISSSFSEEGRECLGFLFVCLFFPRSIETVLGHFPRIWSFFFFFFIFWGSEMGLETWIKPLWY